tara:strand:- start:662 stop:862 length:201 start_codon:yes stop_codon:yes gene_type:complete
MRHLRVAWVEEETHRGSPPVFLIYLIKCLATWAEAVEATATATVDLIFVIICLLAWRKLSLGAKLK